MKTPISTDVTARANSAWIRWLPNALPAAGYITLENSSLTRLEINKIKSPDYKGITMYRTVTDAESSRMEKVDQIALPAEGSFSLSPGGYHLIFEKPTHLITPGDNARAIFFLSNGQVFKVRMPVRTSPELY